MEDKEINPEFNYQQTGITVKRGPRKIDEDKTTHFGPGIPDFGGFAV